jgi:hypothetical protein
MNWQRLTTGAKNELSQAYYRSCEWTVTALESRWNLMAHGDAREGKWTGNWRMEWVASTLTLPRNVVYPALQPLMRTPRLPAVDWTDAPADLNGLVRFGERRILDSARVPSRFKRSLLQELRMNWQRLTTGAKNELAEAYYRRKEWNTWFQSPTAF